VIADDLDTLDAQQLRDALRAARSEVAFKQAVIDKLTHENAILKRLKFAAQSERYSAEQKSLLDETLDADLAAVAAEIEGLQPVRPAGERQKPRRERLPAHLPRRDVRHEPESTTCPTPNCGQAMQRIGEDVAEKLDYIRRSDVALLTSRLELMSAPTSNGPRLRWLLFSEQALYASEQRSTNLAPRRAGETRARRGPHMPSMSVPAGSPLAGCLA
jgi:hypothetical protein